MSGAIEELSAPGGWKATFRREARRPALEGSVLERVEFVPKGMAYEIAARFQAIPASSTPLLVLHSPPDIPYSRPALRDYVDTLSANPRFRFVAIVDESEQLVGHVPAWSVLALLREDSWTADLMASLEAGDPFAVLEPLPYPPTREPTLLDALRQMDNARIDALLVLDENQRIRGVVHRDVVLARLMLALAAELD